MEFKTLEAVPIVSTGTYALGTGEATFTADDLASAVLAAKDPTVSLPRIKIGHVDKRFETDDSLDGEPAMGTVRNLALSDDGQTIVGDLTDVPAWLADSMHSAYPGRSIEGGFGYKAPSGHEYGFVISDLALLGTTWPGVGSLDDLREVLSKNGAIKTDTVQAASKRFVAASVGTPVTAKLDAEDEAEVKRLEGTGLTRAAAIKKVEQSADEKREERMSAALDVGGIPRVFAADLRAGKVPTGGEADTSKWWARSVEAADDGALSILVDAAGKLLRLPITVADKALNYGAPQPVAASTINLSVDGKAVAAAVLKGPRVIASWPSSDTAPRPERKLMKINEKDIEQAVLAKALGLAENADEAAIMAALGDDSAGSAEAAATTDATGDKPETPAVATPTAPVTGTVTIDAAKLAELEENAKAGAGAAAKMAEAEDEADVKAAIEEGRIVAKSSDEWMKRFKADREGTKTLLRGKVEDGGLAAVIPVSQIEAGRTGDGDGQNIAASAPRILPELRETEAAA